MHVLMPRMIMLRGLRRHKLVMFRVLMLCMVGMIMMHIMSGMVIRSCRSLIIGSIEFLVLLERLLIWQSLARVSGRSVRCRHRQAEAQAAQGCQHCIESHDALHS